MCIANFKSKTVLLEPIKGLSFSCEDCASILRLSSVYKLGVTKEGLSTIKMQSTVMKHKKYLTNAHWIRT